MSDRRSSPDGDCADDPDATSVTPLSTIRGGKAVPAVDASTPKLGESDGAADPGDLTRMALADAQSLAQSLALRRPRRAKRGRTQGKEDRSAGGYSGAGPDGNDPQLVGGVLARYVSDRGWEQPLAEARVFADWAGLVGEDVALHCRPTALTAGELRVEAESTAWATQLRLLSATVLARLVEQIGPDVVSRLHITGPVGPTWKHGGFAVRSARGPRDTYG